MGWHFNGQSLTMSVTSVNLLTHLICINLHLFMTFVNWFNSITAGDNRRSEEPGPMNEKKIWTKCRLADIFIWRHFPDMTSHPLRMRQCRVSTHVPVLVRAGAIAKKKKKMNIEIVLNWNIVEVGQTRQMRSNWFSISTGTNFSSSCFLFKDTPSSTCSHGP